MRDAQTRLDPSQWVGLSQSFPTCTHTEVYRGFNDMSGADLVQTYLAQNYRCVFWPAHDDSKGPKEKNWPQKAYQLTDYHEGYRVGILTGTEVEPGKFLTDIDIDFGLGAHLALKILPQTGFVFGRDSKRISHCFYTTTDPLPSFRYEDIDKTCLIELRGTKGNGELGLQTMAPPSVWSKDGKREPLSFVSQLPPTHVESGYLKQRVCLAAIGMLLAKHLGKHGFGHDVRLAWAGFLLRASLAIDDLVTMGEAMSVYCQNTEQTDVRRTLNSTATSLLSDGKKVKGGPALARILGKDGKAIITRINEWLGRDSDFIRNAQGLILPKHQGNIRRAIELLGHDLSYNEFSDKLLLDGKPMEDREVNHALLQIETELHFQPPPQYFESVIKDLAWSNSFHPVKDYLAGLVWDNIPRIDLWLIVAAHSEDSPYVRALSSILLIAAVRRIQQPGVKYDELVIWESDQGTGKSSAAQALCPNPEWFSDDLSLNLRSQQLIESTLGKWIIEVSELAGRRKTEIDQLKAMLSRQVDGPARMAYGHFPVERPRQFVLIGTTNSPIYLNDSTGGRRFWPMVIQKFDVPWIMANRDQLWAEASSREAAGESIRLKEELWPIAAEHQEARREIDPWEAVIRSLLLNIQPATDGKRRVITNALWDSLSIPVDRRDRMGSLRISEIMQRLGFKRTRVRPTGEEAQVGFVQAKKDALDLVEDEDMQGGRIVGADDDDGLNF